MTQKIVAVVIFEGKVTFTGLVDSFIFTNLEIIRISSFRESEIPVLQATFTALTALTK